MNTNLKVKVVVLLAIASFAVLASCDRYSRYGVQLEPRYFQQPDFSYVREMPASSFAPVTDQEWESFKAQYRKWYPTSEEEALRRKIYSGNKKYIEDETAEIYKRSNGQPSFTIGFQEDSDLMPSERPRRGGFLPRGRIH